jgi:hypothetical protein
MVEERTISIFSVGNQQGQALPNHLLHAGFLFVCFSDLKIEVINPSEKSVHVWIIQLYFPDEARMEEKRNVCRLLVGKPEGKRPLGRPRRRWINTIKMYLLEIGLSVADWICMIEVRYRWRAIVNAVMNLRVP